MKTIALFLLSMLATFGGDKNPVVQENIVQGCITVTNITFHPSTFSVPRASMDGNIVNDCEKDANVTISGRFFNGSDQELDTETIQKLSTARNTTRFWISYVGIDRAKLKALKRNYSAKTARVINVLAQ
jgi:hypothetical protein